MEYQALLEAIYNNLIKLEIDTIPMILESDIAGYNQIIHYDYFQQEIHSKSREELEFNRDIRQWVLDSFKSGERLNYDDVSKVYEEHIKFLTSQAENKSPFWVTALRVDKFIYENYLKLAHTICHRFEFRILGDNIWLE